ncbi:uncharacterized protein LOC111870189 isoform X2 [Cryptotermes secundus]|nr:uncharacterized protein LOC111870189 isoform X2 [Cryptotermes secundus]
MIADSYQQWSCIECVIKKQEYEDNLSKLEKRFQVYKEKLILTHELIKKFNTKCKENETLQKQLKQLSALLKEYQSKLTNTMTKQMPLEEELEKLKKIKVALEEKLESEANQYAATEKHNIQLNSLAQQLKDKVSKYEAEIELRKETASNLTQSLKEAKSEKLSVEKKRLKTLQNVVSFADFVQKEGRLAPTHKKMLARWRLELTHLVNGKGDFSEDEEIFSPETASSCSSRDTGMGSVSELLSDDDQNPVTSVNLESVTSCVKEQSGAILSDVVCKPLTSDCTKKVRHRKSHKLSPGIVVPLTLGSDKEVMLGSNGIQVHDSPKVVPVLRTELAKRNSCDNALASLGVTSVREVQAKKRSEVDHMDSSDGNMIVGPTLVADAVSGMKSVSLPSLFDPDVPLTLSRPEFKEAGTTNGAVTNFSGGSGGLVSVVDNSDCKSTFSKAESPVDTVFYIQNIMEEMRSVPNLLSPLNPGPETVRIHCQSESSIESIKEAGMHDASTQMCVEMLDAAAGVDTIAEPSCHVAVQTCGDIAYRIACQTSINTCDACAVTTDDITILHTANNVSHPEGKFSNFKLPESKTTCSIDKKETAETIFSRKVNTEAEIQTQCVTDFPLASIGKVKMLDASTSACVEMLDAAVGVDTVAEPSCHVSVQTSGVTTYGIACQTNIADYDTCDVQMDDVTIPHTANCISPLEDRLSNCKLLEEKTNCNVGKKQSVETKLCRKVDAEAGIQMQCFSDNSILSNDKLKLYGSLLKGAEKERFFSLTLKQNSVESKSKNQSTMIRCDYKKPEKCLREEVKKWQSLVAWLCSNRSDGGPDENFPCKSDDSPIAAPTAQSSTNKLLTHQRIPLANKRLTQHSTPAADKPLTQRIIPAPSGLFAVEDDPCSSGYCKKFHSDEWLMPVVPDFQHHYMHVDPLQFQPNRMNCKLAMPSMAELSKSCCYKNAVIGAIPNINHHCVSHTAHTCQEVRNCCCCLCVNTNHSNHKPHEREEVMQISCIRSTSDKKSDKQTRNRIMDTEDSHDGSVIGDSHKMPSRKMFHKRQRIESTSSMETGSETENMGSRRRGIYAEKQDISVDAGPGRKMAVKRLWKRRKVAQINGRYCQISMDEERKYRTARSRKRSRYLKENHLQPDNQQHNSIFSRVQRRKNKHDHKKGLRKCVSEKMLHKKFPVPKLKHRSKNVVCGQLNEHTDESGTSAFEACRKFDIDQPDAIDSMKNFEAVSCSTEIPTILQINVQQKTEAGTEEDTHKHLSCTELFGSVSDISLDEEQQSVRTAELQTVHPGKVSGSSANRRKRRAPSTSASQVESSSMDCASFETLKSKRAKTYFISEKNNDSMTSKNSETVSNILLHSVSESNSKKHITRTCEVPTRISMSSGEQTHSNQENKMSAVNESCVMPEHQVSAHKTGQSAGKSNASRDAGPRGKLSKLEKLRRKITRAKMPSKIATQLPVKTVKCRKTLTPRSKVNCVGSESNRPGIKSLSEKTGEDETSNSISNVSNLSYRPSHQSIPPLLLDNKPSAKHDTTTHNDVNLFVNHKNCDNSVVDHPVTCNSVTGQICSSTNVAKEPDTRKEIHTETNHAVDMSKSFASKNAVPNAEIPGCFQDRITLSSYVTETVSPVSISEIQTNSYLTDEAPKTVKVLELPINYKDIVPDAEIPGCFEDIITLSSYVTETVSPVSISEIQTNSYLTDEAPKTVKVLELPISYKQNMPEASQISETVGLVTVPHIYSETSSRLETVSEVCSQNMSSETCHAGMNARDVESPATVSKIRELEDIICPKFYQESVPCPVSPIEDPEMCEPQLNSKVIESSVPCPVSPIEDPEMGEPQLNSKVIESLVSTQDTIQIAELPVTELSVDSPGKLTGSLMHKQTGNHITVMKTTITKNTDEKLFAGCVLQWVLKDYEVKYKKNHPKKSKTMMVQLKDKEDKMANEMKQQEKVVSQKELKRLLSSRFTNEKLHEVLQKFSCFNSQSASVVVAKLIVKFVGDDIKAQLDYSNKRNIPPLTPTQQCLVTLAFTLQSQHQQYKDLLETILLGIEYQLFRLGHAPDIVRACSLARFYAAVCLVQRDRRRVLTFCYDAMYCLNFKAFPLLFTVYTTYPDALPHACVGKDILLIMTMSSLTLMQRTEQNLSDYKIEALKNLLQTRYGYRQWALTTEQLIQLLMDQLRNSDGHVEGLEASLILLAKRIGWETSYRQLLCHNLIPLVDEWRAHAVSDLTIREVIIVMGYITRCFPVVEAKACVQAILNLLGTILLEQNVSMEVQEAAASSLLRLSRHNFFYVSSVLVKWIPSSSSISDSLLTEMLTFFELRNPKWWQTFLKRNQVYV